MIITNHRYENYLENAITSAIQQHHPPIDIIVVDDEPSTHAKSITKSFSQYGVRYAPINAQHPLLARQYGCSLTAANYICFLDADDELERDYLFNAGLIITGKSADIVYSDIQYFGLRNNKSNLPKTIPAKRISQTNFLHVGCVVNRELIYTADAFNCPKTKDYHEDWAFWRKLLRITNNYYKQEATYKARVHDTNRSTLLNMASYYQLRGIKHATKEFITKEQINTIQTNAEYLLFGPPEYDYDKLLMHLSHDIAIVHDGKYQDFECTIAVADVLKSYRYEKPIFDSFKYTINEKILII